MKFFITEWSGKKILSGFFPGSGSGLEKSRIRICFVLRDWIRPDIETLETPINAIDKNWKKLTQPWSKVAHLSGSDSILASSCQIGVEYSEKQKKNHLYKTHIWFIHLILISRDSIGWHARKKETNDIHTDHSWQCS